MPSPVGHALGGLIVSLAVGPRARPGGPGAGPGRQARWRLPVDRHVLLWSVVTACLPDIDFAWGRHSMETHSLGFVALVGLTVWGLTRSPALAASCSLSGATHVLFDWLGSDDFPPLGVMALWPFSEAFYFADAYVFAKISRQYWLPGFVEHNVLAVAREVIILLPVAMLVFWTRARGDRRRSQSIVSHGGTQARS
jgi:hypothetical protein